MHKLLFVDDDHNILKINKVYFESRGYSVMASDNVNDAMELVKKYDFDCIILDIILSNRNDGYNLCKSIRDISSAPILFLTSLTEQDFLYQGFSSGGDDYITKPYDLKELMMRIDCCIKRYRVGRQQESIISIPPLSVNLTSRRAELNQQVVSLTGVEFDILAFMCSHPNEAFAPNDIYSHVWKMPDLDATHTVQVHIARLRHKLDALCPEHRFIQTVWGKGYILVPPPQK